MVVSRGCSNEGQTVTTQQKKRARSTLCISIYDELHIGMAVRAFRTAQQ